MSKFRFKNYIFKSLLPFFYQHNDTYKDEDGKGILERFMEIGSAYFDGLKDTQEVPSSYDSSLPGLDSFLDLIDVDKTPDIFLNYLWELLGEIPYGYGVIVQNKSPEDISIINPTNYLEVNTRDLLRYAISLYRIRGTELFYDILGKFYGVEFTLIETTPGGDPLDPESPPTYDHLVLATYTNSNNEESVATYGYSQDEIRAAYPDGNCTDCLYYLIKVKVSEAKYMEWLTSGQLDLVKETLISILSKYLPIHCMIASYEDGSKKIIFEVSLDLHSDFNTDNI